MAANADRGREIDERLLRMGSEPTRLKALAILNERSLGASELAEQLAISVTDASRHLERMQEDDLVEAVGEVLGVSAIEPAYRATLKAVWSDDDWAELDLSERRALAARAVQAISVAVCDGLESGTFHERAETHISRQVARVDEQGWRELSQICARAMEDSIAVEARSAERLAASGEEGLLVLTAMICGELPPPAAESR